MEDVVPAPLVTAEPTNGSPGSDKKGVRVETKEVELSDWAPDFGRVFVWCTAHLVHGYRGLTESSYTLREYANYLIGLVAA